MNNSSLNDALRKFEVVEANLAKAERVLHEIEAAIPKGVAFGEDPKHENLCRSFYSIFASLPPIDEWLPDITLLDLDEIAQSRLDAQEIGEVERPHGNRFPVIQQGTLGGKGSQIGLHLGIGKNVDCLQGMAQDKTVHRDHHRQ